MKDSKNKAIEKKKAPSVASYLRQQRKQKHIEKLVRNAPEGSALRPWNYDKQKYV